MNDYKSISIKFADWLSKNYDIDNGIGHWIDYDEHNTTYTTEELWDKFNIQLRENKLKIIKNEINKF